MITPWHIVQDKIKEGLKENRIMKVEIDREAFIRSKEFREFFMGQLDMEYPLATITEKCELLGEWLLKDKGGIGYE